MARRRLALALLLLGAPLALAACDEPVEHPNIVLIVADDLAWNDLGFMGSPHVKTPNLDRLAASGTVFTHGYSTASVGKPALRSLLTGLYPLQWKHRVDRLEEFGFHRPEAVRIADFDTIPRILWYQGYSSFQGGKYWEGNYGVAGFTDGMQQLGDDTAHGGVGRGLGRQDLKPLFRFIDGHADAPFLVWFAPELPHLPHDAPDRYRAPYQGLTLSPRAIDYYANITRLDDVVGQLLAHLDEKKLRKRTLVVFLADNGWDQRPDQTPPPGKDGPRGKQTLHDVGLRTPIVFSWPGVVRKGVRRGELVSSVDLFPTFLDYGGGAPSRERPGRSLRPLLEGTEPAPAGPIIGHMVEARIPREADDASPPPPPEDAWGVFLRTPEWRYIWYPDLDRDALYAIESDPFETRNLAAEHPDRVAEFRKQIEQWQRDMAARLRETGIEPGMPVPAGNEP